MKRLAAILFFYQPLLVWSFIANFIIAFINPLIAPALVTKLCLTIFAWYYTHESTERRKLVFYKNLGISPLLLFAVIFFIDCIITVLFLSIFKEFTSY